MLTNLNMQDQVAEKKIKMDIKVDRSAEYHAKIFLEYLNSKERISRKMAVLDKISDEDFVSCWYFYVNIDEKMTYEICSRKKKLSVDELREVVFAQIPEEFCQESAQILGKEPQQSGYSAIHDEVDLAKCYIMHLTY